MVKLERVLAEAGVAYPVCIGGQGACPPEDCSGMWGYERFLKAIADPKAPDHATHMDWLGGHFDPERFDLGLVNLRLSGL